MSDGLVISPPAALRGILRHCSVHVSTPHSSGFLRVPRNAQSHPFRVGPSLSRLASGAFYWAVLLMSFNEVLRV
jgi:hypothetical protein